MILGFAISSSAKFSFGGRKTTKQKKLPSRELAYPTKQESRKNHPASRVSADWDIGYVIVPRRVTSIDPKTRSSESPASPSSPQFPPPKNLVGPMAPWQLRRQLNDCHSNGYFDPSCPPHGFPVVPVAGSSVHNFSGKTSGKSLGPHF